MSVERTRAMIDHAGVTVTLRRITGTTVRTNQDVAVKASVLAYDYKPELGPLMQNDRKVTFNPEPAYRAGWPMPPKTGDKVLIDGAVTNVESVEARHFGEDIAFFVLRVRG